MAAPPPVFPDGVLERVFELAGAENVIRLGGARVCRQWCNVLLHGDDGLWEAACGRSGVGHMSRPDGEPIPWREIFLECEKSRIMRDQAMAAVYRGESVLLTGPGGVGKTVLVGVLVETLRAQGIRVAVTATTGTAAVHISGQTLHSFAGVGLGRECAEDLIKRMNFPAKKRWRNTDVLFIDEVSMLEPALFEKLDTIARSVRGRQDLFFGGLQLVCSGDFFQLPPVNPEGLRFVFQLASWEAGITRVFPFEFVYRQSDYLFGRVLSRVRRGRHDAEDLCILRTRVGKPLMHLEALGIKPTRMYSHRKDVTAENTRFLGELEGAPETFAMRHTAAGRGGGPRPLVAGQRQPAPIDRALNMAKRTCPAEESLVLKPGAQVMLVVNLDVSGRLVNGSRGVVVGINAADRSVSVRFTDGVVRVVVEHRWEKDDARDDRGLPFVLHLCQIPLKLAYAITIHKSQGMTLDAAVVDLGESVFEPGQGYVALSRIRELNAVSITSLNNGSIRADPLVCSYYNYIDKHGTHVGWRDTVCDIRFPSENYLRVLLRRVMEQGTGPVASRSERVSAEAAKAHKRGRREEEGGDSAQGSRPPDSKRHRDDDGT